MRTKLTFTDDFNGMPRMPFAGKDDVGNTSRAGFWLNLVSGRAFFHVLLSGQPPFDPHYRSCFVWFQVSNNVTDAGARELAHHSKVRRHLQTILNSVLITRKNAGEIDVQMTEAAEVERIELAQWLTTAGCNVFETLQACAPKDWLKFKHIAPMLHTFETLEQAATFLCRRADRDGVFLDAEETEEWLMDELEKIGRSSGWFHDDWTPDAR